MWSGTRPRAGRRGRPKAGHDCRVSSARSAMPNGGAKWMSRSAAQLNHQSVSRHNSHRERSHLTRGCEVHNRSGIGPWNSWHRGFYEQVRTFNVAARGLNSVRIGTFTDSMSRVSDQPTARGLSKNRWSSAKYILFIKKLTISYAPSSGVNTRRGRRVAAIWNRGVRMEQMG